MLPKISGLAEFRSISAERRTKSPVRVPACFRNDDIPAGFVYNIVRIHITKEILCSAHGTT